MIVTKSFKTELDPTKEQIDLFKKHADARRFVYNWMLGQCMSAFENKTKKPSQYDLVKRFRSEIKPNLSWYSEISSRTEEGASRDLDQAYEHFFRRVKSGKKGKSAGFPKFNRKRDGNGSFSTFGTIRISESTVQVQKLGIIRLKERGFVPVESRITSATISTRGGRWFISCVTTSDVSNDKDQAGIVGVDLGIKTSIVVSDGTSFNSQKPKRKYAKKIRKLNKSLSRKLKGSNRRKKTIIKLTKLHYKISNIRKDFIHKATTELAKTKRVIVIENLNVSGMMRNRNLSNAISDVGFYEIRRQLEYKTKWYGSNLIIADRFYPSSKLCNICGYKNSGLKLSDRSWVCPNCGTVIDRDINAAMNLAELAGKAPDRINGRGGGSSFDDRNITFKPAEEAFTTEGAT